MKHAAMPESLDDLLDAAARRAAEVDLGPFRSDIDPERWTLSGDALRLLVAMVAVLRPGHVLELGSGLSTRVLLRGTRTLDLSPAISSVDHDPEYGPAAARAAAAEADGSRLSCQVAPLVVRSFAGEPFPCYHLDSSRLASADPVDLALIDGPPGPLGGRAGTLFQLMAFARPGTVVLLDDAGRAGERRALRLWEDWLGPAIEVCEPEGVFRRMAVVRVNRPVSPEHLWTHRQSLAVADIRAAVPPGQPLVLLDGAAWDRSLLSDYRLFPLIDLGGVDQGAPADDAGALEAVAGLGRRGIRYLAMGWPAEWWRRVYPSFYRYLEESGRCVSRRGRVRIFDLQPAGR